MQIYRNDTNMEAFLRLFLLFILNSYVCICNVHTYTMTHYYLLILLYEFENFLFYMSRSV